MSAPRNDLKPCPFCGSREAEVFANLVECVSCGAQGPSQEGPEMSCDSRFAVEDWNKREAQHD